MIIVVMCRGQMADEIFDLLMSLSLLYSLSYYFVGRKDCERDVIRFLFEISIIPNVESHSII